MDLVAEICLFLDARPAQSLEHVLAEYKVSLKSDEASTLREIAALKKTSAQKWTALLAAHRERAQRLDATSQRLRRALPMTLLRAAYAGLQERRSREVYDAFLDCTGREGVAAGGAVRAAPYWAQMLRRAADVRLLALRARQVRFGRVCRVAAVHGSRAAAATQQHRALLLRTCMRFREAVNRTNGALAGDLAGDLAFRLAARPVRRAQDHAATAEGVRKAVVLRSWFAARTAPKPCALKSLAPAVLHWGQTRAADRREQSVRASKTLPVQLVVRAAQSTWAKARPELPRAGGPVLASVALQEAALAQRAGTEYKRGTARALFAVDARAMRARRRAAYLFMANTKRRHDRKLHDLLDVGRQQVRRRERRWVLDLMRSRRDPGCELRPWTRAWLGRLLAAQQRAQHKSQDLVRERLDELGYLGVDAWHEAHGSLRQGAATAALLQRTFAFGFARGRARQIASMEPVGTKLHSWAIFELVRRVSTPAVVAPKMRGFTEALLARLLAVHPRQFDALLQAETLNMFEVMLDAAADVRELESMRFGFPSFVFRAFLDLHCEITSGAAVATRMCDERKTALVERLLDRCLHDDFQLQSLLQSAQSRCRSRPQTRLSFQILTKNVRPSQE